MSNGDITSAAATHWVFAYGSLIWRPDFPYLHAEPATLEGYHRSLCVLSHKYRGTEDCKGLVFGLDHGGTCQGLCYEVAAEIWPATHAYLSARELVTHVYQEKLLPIHLTGSQRHVVAMTYVVDKEHWQYAGSLDEAEMLEYIRQGHGEAGSCADYVRQTAVHLRQWGCADAGLEALAARI